jgi:hypothetical protein
MEEIKRMTIKEFRELGLLQEVNRLFFHPRGLALEIVIDDETEEMSLGGIWDYRDDPEGIFYGENMLDEDKARRVQKLVDERTPIRIEKYGWTVQPLEGKWLRSKE